MKTKPIKFDAYQTWPHGFPMWSAYHGGIECHVYTGKTADGKKGFEATFQIGGPESKHLEKRESLAPKDQAFESFADRLRELSKEHGFGDE